jgi:hypothetical protein
MRLSPFVVSIQRLQRHSTDEWVYTSIEFVEIKTGHQPLPYPTNLSLSPHNNHIYALSLNGTVSIKIFEE